MIGVFQMWAVQKKRITRGHSRGSIANNKKRKDRNLALHTVFLEAAEPVTLVQIRVLLGGGGERLLFICLFFFFPSNAQGP